MKVTMYELLGMIKDGKAPKKIKYDDMIWEYDGDYYSSKNNIILEEYCNLTTSLKDEIKIIEPQEHKIPEKLDIVLLDQSDNWTRKYNKNLKDFESTHIELNPYVIDVIRQNTLEFQSKINEILDYLEEKE